MLGYAMAIAVQIGIIMILTISVNLQYGFTGLINFGVVAFYAVGAYASALLAIAGVPVPLALLAAALIGALAAIPLGAVAVRLRAEYLAIVTLGFAEVVRLVAQNERWLTGGSSGLGGIPRPTGDWPAPFDALGYVALTGFVLLIVILVIRRIVASPYGRILQAIRDNLEAVGAIGKNANRFKLQILAIGGGIAAEAGALQAHYIGYVSPEQMVSHQTFIAWMAMIIGGAGRLAGSVIGAAVVMLLFEGSRFMRDVLPGVSEVEMASIRLALVGLALILFTVYRPQGLAGDYNSR